MKRIIVFLLLIAIVICTMVSCGKPTEISGETTVTEQETKSEVSTSIEDILGFKKSNLQSIDFNILLNNSTSSFNMAADFQGDLNGNVFEQAVATRNDSCEEYFGIVLQYTPRAGRWDSGMPAYIQNLIGAGSCDYDMVVMGMNTGIIGNIIDIYSNIINMDIDLDNPWWVQDMTNTVSINDHLFFLTGDACMSTYAYLGCVFANLQVAENFNLDINFYDTVKNQQWTLEKFLNTFKNVENAETIGWANIGTGVRVLWSACDMNLIERQADTSFAVVKNLNTKTLEFMEKLKNAYDASNSQFFASNEAGTNSAVQLFVGDNALFITYFLYLAQSFTQNNMESTYAILPMPKYDDQQTDYISTNISAYNALFFPKSIAERNAILSAHVAEFMGYYGKTSVVPAYYDKTLKLRNSIIEENVEMLDLIRDKLRVTPNEIFGVLNYETNKDIIGLTPQTDTNMSNDGFYTTPASFWSSNYTAMKKVVENYILQYIFIED